MLLAPLLLAWTRFVPPPSFPVVYYVAPEFCNVLLPRFYEDRMLSLHGITCVHLRTMLRTSFDAWSYHVPSAAFFETPHEEDADLIISADNLDEDTLAVARIAPYTMRIHMDDNRCWFSEASFCDTVSRIWPWLSPLLLTLWFAAVVITVGMVCTGGKRPLALLFALAMAVWVPLLYWGAYRPCLVCYDGHLVFLHEIGHIMGLGHSDTATQSCGCTNVTTDCNTITSSVMSSKLSHGPTQCLGDDDIDGARALIAPDACDAPHWCYHEVGTMGATRILCAGLYSTFVAAVIVNAVRLFRSAYRHNK